MTLIRLGGYFAILCSLLVAPAAGLTQENPGNNAPATQESSASNEPPAQDGTANQPSKPTMLDPLVISATRTERTVSDLPVSSTVLDQRQIEQSPAILVDDVLREVPTLNLQLLPSTMQHPTASNPSMRGLGDGRALFLVDGVPLNDPFFGYVDFNRIPKENIQRVEIVRGASSSLWGGFAEGGLVNIFTKPIDASRTVLTTMGGSDATFRTDLSATQRIDDRLGIGLDVNYFSTEGFVSAQNPLPYSRATSSTVANVQLRTTYQTSDFEGFIRGNFFDSGQNLRTKLTSDTSKIASVATGGSWFLDAQDMIHGSVFFMNQIASSQGSDADPNAPGTEFISNLHSTPSSDIGGSLQWTRTDDRGSLPLLTAGIDLRNIVGSDRQQLIDPTGGLYNVTLKNAGGQQFFAGVFGEADYRPVKAWEILPSIRVDYVLNYAASERNNVPGAPVADINFDDKDFIQVNPKLATKYQLSDPLAIRASVYRGFKYPTIDQLYRTFSATGFSIIPNNQLDPEVLWGGEMGLDLNQGRFHGQFNVFYNIVKDQLNYVVASFFPVFTLQPTNIGELRSQGAELMGDLQITDTLSAGLSYSYTDAKIASYPLDPSIEGNQTPFVPVHNVSVVARYRHQSGARAEVRGRYLSEMVGDTSDTPGILDAHTIVDLSAAYPLTKHVEAFMLIQNLFDTEYVANTIPGNQMGAPFQIFGGLTFTLGG
jgi:outer membrane receptor protein involved in Fe transport